MTRAAAARAWIGQLGQLFRRRPAQAAIGLDWMRDSWEPPRPDIEDILGERPPRGLRRLHYAVALLFAALVAIAALAQVDIVVTGSGRIAADAPVMVVQPVTLSVVREIRVRPGDRVRRGDVLATLDPTLTAADKAALVAQQAALAAQILRLEAELRDAVPVFPDASEDARLQAALAAQRRQHYAARRAAFDEEIARLRAEAAASDRALASLAQQIAVARELEAMRGDLFEKRIGSKITFLEARAQRLRAEREHQEAATRLENATRTMLAREADRQAFANDWQRQTLEDLAKARGQDAVVAETLAKAVMLAERVTLIAPEDGVVLAVARRSAGSVLNPAEALITLSPTGAELIAEVMIGSADIGYLLPGQRAALKIDAFPFQRHGTLTGQLRSVGAESLAPGDAGALPASGQPLPGAYHRSQIVLDRAALRQLPDRAALVPGMTLSAEIQVGSRSVLSYFLYPILRGFDEALREP